MSVVVLGPDFTVDNLVSSVQLRGTLPTTQTLFTTDNIIQLMDEEMRATLFSMVKALKEEFWVVNKDNTIIANQASYQIPYRATAAGLRDLVFVDSNGNELKLTRYEPEDIKFPLIPYGSPYFPLGFYLKDNAVVLFPPNAAQYTAYTLRMKYERRPNNLITKNEAGQITAINTNTNTITLSFVPSAWTTSTNLDIINNIPPFNSVGDDQVITAINGLDVTLQSLPSDIAINYWVAPSMQTPVPQVPYEAFPILAQLGVIKCLEALGDISALDKATKKFEDMKIYFDSMMTPRVEGTPKVLSNRNGVFDYGRNVWGSWGSW